MSDVHALSGAYAVDALDDLERARFEAHLAECADCRAEVADLRETAAALAAAEEATPPDHLRAQVLAGIGQIRPLPPLAGGARAAAPRRGRTSWLVAAAAAVVLLGGAVGVAVTQPWQDESSQSQLSATERVLAAGDAESVTLDFPDGSSATVTRSESEDRAVIRTRDMAPAPDGRVYQLWLQQPDGAMVPAGLMPPEPDQTTMLEGDLGRAVGAGITVEPAGGSQEPTTEPVGVFDFTRAT